VKNIHLHVTSSGVFYIYFMLFLSSLNLCVKRNIHYMLMVFHTLTDSNSLIICDLLGFLVKKRNSLSVIVNLFVAWFQICVKFTNNKWYQLSSLLQYSLVDLLLHIFTQVCNSYACV